MFVRALEQTPWQQHITTTTTSTEPHDYKQEETQPNNDTQNHEEKRKLKENRNAPEINKADTCCSTHMSKSPTAHAEHDLSHITPTSPAEPIHPRYWTHGVWASMSSWSHDAQHKKDHHTIVTFCPDHIQQHTCTGGYIMGFAPAQQTHPTYHSFRVFYE